MKQGIFVRIPNPTADKDGFQHYYATKLRVDGKLLRALFTGYELADLDAVPVDKEDAEIPLGEVTCTVTVHLPLPTDGTAVDDVACNIKLPIGLLQKAVDRAIKQKSLITRIGLCQ